MFASIFLPLSGSAHEGHAIDTVVQMADWMQAQVVVVHASLLPIPPPSPWGVAPELMVFTPDPGIQKNARQKAQALRGRLSQESVLIRVEELEAYEYEFPVRLAQRARTSSLVVMPSMPDPSDRVFSLRMFQALVSHAGRPVLSLPPSCQWPRPPERAMLAWKSSVHCARALHDALPLLRACHNVEVVHLVDANAPAVLDPGSASAFRELGIPAAWREMTAPLERSASRALIDQARRSDAEFIVAGAYGHSRLHEWILGSTTKDMFLNCPLPVLFSH